MNLKWSQLKALNPELYALAREMTKGQGKPRRPRVKGRGLGPGETRPSGDRRSSQAVDPGPLGRWTVEIPGWKPLSLNQLHAIHWAKWGAAKQADADMVAVYCRKFDVPRAVRKRRVSINVRRPRGWGRHADHDNLNKVLYDALKAEACGALVDDGPEWCVTGDYKTEDGPLRTIITLEDL